MNKRKKNIIKTALAVLILGVIIFSARTGVIKNIKGRVFRIFRPVAELVVRLKNISLWSRDAEKTIREKDLRIRTLEFKLHQAEQENQTLAKVLNFKNQGKFNLRGVRTVFYGKELGREFLILDSGQKDGLRVADLVIDENRVLLGKITEVEDDFSKVDIASNAGLNFEVEIPGSGLRALAEGLGNRTFAIKLVPRENQLKAGDFVSLTGGYYNSLLLAQISSVRSSGGGAFLEITATSLSNPENSKNVFIIQNSRN